MQEPLYQTSQTHSRRWIAATMAVLLLVTLPSILPPDGQTHTGQFLGRFHVALVHLPIGLLLLLPVLDFGSRRRSELRLAAVWTANLAAIAAVVTALLGIVLAHAGAFPASQVRFHLWGGVALAVLVTVFAVVRPALRSPGSASLALAAITVWVAHTGGAITYGDGWLTEFAPHLSALAPSRKYPAVNPDGEYARKVQPILDGNCVKCHGPSERKGNLRLDSYAHLMDGGASGDIVAAGHVERSILIHRITLPLGDPKLMPKKGERLSDAEIETLKQWVAAGASPTAAVVGEKAQ